MQADAPTTLCPACGHSRIGIEHDARCPECGAVGFSGTLIIEGIVARPFGTQASFTLLLVALLGVPTIVSMIAVFRQGVFTADVGALLMITGTLWALVVWSFFSKRRREGPNTSSNGIWVVHPGGVVIVANGRSRQIQVDSIARVASSDSLIGPVTQLVLRPRALTRHRITGEQVLYLRGSDDERHALAQRAEEILGFRPTRAQA